MDKGMLVGAITGLRVPWSGRLRHAIDVRIKKKEKKTD